MPTFSGALSLAQYALMTEDRLQQAVLYSMIQAGTVFQDIPFVTAQVLTVNGRRVEGMLPQPDWVRINDPATPVSASLTPFADQAYIIRNNIDVDHLLVEDRNQIINPRGFQTDAYLRGLVYDLNDKFVNNNHTTGDVDAPVGIRARIDNGQAYGVRAENKIDAGGVDLTFGTNGISPRNGNQFLEQLDQLLWSVDAPDGNGVVIWHNDVMGRRFASTLRQMGGQGGFSIAQDQFGRVVTQYKGAILRDAGYRADQASRVISATETANGSADTGGTFTSMYAAKLDQQHFFGWWWGPPSAKDLGLMNDGVIYRTFLEWVGGLFNASTRSLGRLHNIKIA